MIVTPTANRYNFTRRITANVFICDQEWNSERNNLVGRCWLAMNWKFTPTVGTWCIWKLFQLSETCFQNIYLCIWFYVLLCRHKILTRIYYAAFKWFWMVRIQKKYLSTSCFFETEFIKCLYACKPPCFGVFWWGSNQ